MRRRTKRNTEAIALARHERRRVFVALTMAEIEQAVSQPQRGAVRRHIAKPHREMRLRRVAFDLDLDRRLAEDLQRLVQRRTVETEALRIVDTLVIGQVGTEAIGALIARPIAVGFRAADL